MKFTKHYRKKIIDEHIAEFGSFEPRKFFEVVREVGAAHPAFLWFEWDKEVAFTEHNVTRAREFVQGITIKVEITPLVEKAVSVQVVEVPAYVSPEEARTNGGGYLQFDPSKDLDELSKQASHALKGFLSRYRGILTARGIAYTALEDMVNALLPDADITSAAE